MAGDIWLEKLIYEIIEYTDGGMKFWQYRNLSQDEKLTAILEDYRDTDCKFADAIGLLKDAVDCADNIKCGAELAMNFLQKGNDYSIENASDEISKINSRQKTFARI